NPRLARPHGAAALRPADAGRLAARRPRVVEPRADGGALRSRARHRLRQSGPPARRARAAPRRSHAPRARAGVGPEGVEFPLPGFSGVHEAMKIDRRAFLRAGLAAGLAPAAVRLYAAPQAPARFLLVFLRGGYDAASLLVPASSAFYYE